jgi:hypothetical protein
MKDLIQNKFVKKKAPKNIGQKVHFLCPHILDYVTIMVFSTRGSKGWYFNHYS